MSANNCTIIKQYKDKYLVFDNINAETWEDGDSKSIKLPLKGAIMICETRDEAIDFAMKLEGDDYTEYGIQFERLPKDGTLVEIG